MRKENQGLTEAGEFGRVPNPLVVCFLFFDVLRRGAKAYALQTTRRGEYMFVGCPIFGRQGRGVLNTPHKTTRQGRVQDDGKDLFRYPP